MEEKEENTEEKLHPKYHNLDEFGLWIYGHHYRWLLQKVQYFYCSPSFFDVLDGFAARKLQAQSELGKELIRWPTSLVLGLHPLICTTF